MHIHTCVSITFIAYVYNLKPPEYIPNELNDAPIYLLRRKCLVNLLNNTIANTLNFTTRSYKNYYNRIDYGEYKKKKDQEQKKNVYLVWV